MIIFIWLICKIQKNSSRETKRYYLLLSLIPNFKNLTTLRVFKGNIFSIGYLNYLYKELYFYKGHHHLN